MVSTRRKNYSQSVSSSAPAEVYEKLKKLANKPSSAKKRSKQNKRMGGGMCHKGHTNKTWYQLKGVPKGFAIQPAKLKKSLKRGLLRRK